MNTKIEWLTAPYGATAYQPAGPEQYEGWYRKDANGEIEWWRVDGHGKDQWTWMGGRQDYPHGTIVKPAEKVIVRLQTTAEQLGWAAIDWSKAPEGTMGFHQQANGYVDHWVKWTENGDNWFCVCGFEAEGWQQAVTPFDKMMPNYRERIVCVPNKLASNQREDFAKELFQLVVPEGNWHKLSEEAKNTWRKAFDSGYRKTIS